MAAVGFSWWAAFSDETRWAPPERTELLWSAGELRTTGGKHFYLYREGRTTKLVCPIGVSERGPSFWCFPEALGRKLGQNIIVGHGPLRGVNRVAPVYEIRIERDVLVSYPATAAEALRISERLYRRPGGRLLLPMMVTAIAGWLGWHMLRRPLRRQVAR